MKKSKTLKPFQYFYILNVFIFIFSAMALAGRLRQLHQGNEFYRQTGEAGTLVSKVSMVSAAPAGKGKFLVPSAAPEAGRQEKIPVLPDELSLCLSRYAKKYPATAAWIQIPGTSLDYPVMSGADNQYYLNHLPDGSENALGSLFLDYRQKEDSLHLIIYGHNGFGGSMFGMLKQYESPDYFAQHKTVKLAVEDSVFCCPIFSVRQVEADGGAYVLDFKDKNDMADYIKCAAADSLYPIDTDVKNAERVLTLSTCTGRSGKRWIIQAAFPASDTAYKP